MIFRSRRKEPPPAPPAPPRTESTVTVGDLLQFKKRAEQPPPEFWTDFERQLKQRQLAAAIQEKHSPWWHALPRIAIAIPAGATAALAISFIVWRSSAPEPAPAENTLAEHTFPGTQDTGKASAPAATAPRAAEPAVAQTKPPAPAPAAAVATTEQPARTTAAEAAATKPVPKEHLETARTAFTSIAPARSHRTGGTATIALYGIKPQTTKTTSTAALFQMPVVIDSDLIAALPAPTATDQPTTNTFTTTESPVTQTTHDPADSRRERLLTYADNIMPAAAVSTDNPRVTRLRDRVTSRFDDKALSDSISRVAATGDSLTIKF